MPRFHRDQVRLVLAGQETILTQKYDVKSHVLQVPASFSLTLTEATAAANLAAAFPEATPFELYVGDQRVQHGETDGYDLGGGNAKDGSSITLTGRDPMARLVDEEIENERTFSEKTFEQLTRIALDEVGLTDSTIVASDAARKLAITGTQTVKQSSKGTPTETVQEDVSGGENTETKIVRNTVRAEVGTKWFQFLIDQYRKRGLFLWSRDVGFILSEPNKEVTPSYRLVRKLDGSENNILDHRFRRDGKQRHSKCVVYGRGGGGKNGRGRVRGEFVDDEATQLFGDRKKRVIYNKKIKSAEEAEFLARRTIAKSRRDGWALTYIVAGHTTRTIDGGIWFPWLADTVVEVHDEVLGVFGNMYLQGVDYSGQPETLSALHMMRVEDMFFAEQVPSTGKSVKAKKGLQPRVGVTSVERVLRSASGRIVLLEDND